MFLLLWYFLLFTLQRVGSKEATRNKHIPTKRDPRGCLLGHTKKWDFRVDPRPSGAFFFLEVQIQEKRCSGARQKKSGKSVARQSSVGNRSRRLYCWVTTCASLERFECVFSTISVLAGWSREWTTSRLCITGPSPRLQRRTPRSASRTLRRPPS